VGSVEVLYSIEGQVIAVHGDGTVLKQSTREQPSLLRTCKGTVATSDFSHRAGNDTGRALLCLTTEVLPTACWRPKDAADALD